MSKADFLRLLEALPDGARIGQRGRRPVRTAQIKEHLLQDAETEVWINLQDHSWFMVYFTPSGRRVPGLHKLLSKDFTPSWEIVTVWPPSPLYSDLQEELYKALREKRELIQAAARKWREQNRGS